MKEKLHISLLQLPLKWGNIESNLELILSWLQELIYSNDLIVLPEMCLSGYSVDTQYAIHQDHQSIQRILHLTRDGQCAIYGSFSISENGKFYNRGLWMETGQIMHTYDKRHLFTLSNEQKSFAHGEHRQTVTYKGWKFLLSICYDIRFPVWLRNADRYDVLLNVANWPKTRIDAWHSLLKARAIENQVYVIGCNVVGIDKKKNTYNGGSCIYDYSGKTIRKLGDEETVIKTTINKKPLDAFRKSFPFLNDQDAFSLD